LGRKLVPGCVFEEFFEVQAGGQGILVVLCVERERERGETVSTGFWKAVRERIF